MLFHVLNLKASNYSQQFKVRFCKNMQTCVFPSGDKQVDGPRSRAVAVGEGKHIILFGILTFGSAVANICYKT